MVFTGDLGIVGKEMLVKLIKDHGIKDPGEHYEDCGALIYDRKRQKTNAGGSGCGCCASVLCAYILPGIAAGKWKKVLFVPTGALMSKVSFNEQCTVPGIAQAIVLEKEE